MNIKQLARDLMSVGVIITASALIWWHSFFRVIATELDPGFGESDPTLGSAITCIYSRAGRCGATIAAAGALGKTAYNPALFWAGLGVLAAGAALKLSQKDRPE